ncbi:hypothetical protein NIES2100_46690 [Calothrix sp. NIES-2100]|uniref:eCIS core domain-containing protein n=1 Tax=Calothrix sp. NIES-2100 TaxID=1954172 RepID=UPI000B5FF0B3|nr:hypothetical protein NIES2100_46690 [Calothrix sp. NIES-2100]
MSKQRQVQKKPASHFSPPSLASIQKNSSWLRSLSSPSPDVAVQQKSQFSGSDRGFDLTQIKVHAPSAMGIQAKLKVGAPGDQYEQQADAIASQVMSMSTPTFKQLQRDVMPEDENQQEEVQTKPLAAAITPLVQREMIPEDEKKKEDETLQTKLVSGENSQVDENLEAQLQTTKGSGSPLPDQVRTFMEPRFGVDFSNVRLHTDNAAVQMNRTLTAQAFTHGDDIYFGSGKSEHNSHQGKELLAHELTHVVQQTQPGKKH